MVVGIGDQATECGQQRHQQKISEGRAIITRHQITQPAPEQHHQRHAQTLTAVEASGNKSGDREGHRKEQQQQISRRTPMRQELHIKRLTLTQARGGKPVPVLIAGKKTDQQHTRQHGWHRPQRQHRHAGANIKRLAPLCRRMNADDNSDDIDQRDGEYVEQHSNRQPLFNQVKHRATITEAGAKVGTFGQRKPIDAVLFIKGKTDR